MSSLRQKTEIFFPSLWKEFQHKATVMLWNVVAWIRNIYTYAEDLKAFREYLLNKKSISLLFIYLFFYKFGHKYF